ncbi:MAG: DNA-3-methyladenine glycosylase [Candidatus Sungiibacteriota bacterium]|uniref:Putative 3-methyladenine DNA glycosylase n=1 Tax=Candidatus Sungiibacteriota bacterium TaxID=2750080 RepID=A0A7T5US65_9BACT|nr:MAG: DNA-3-methyladenine glycosylase [Candidatus Sungbacteria bacterium]
MKKVLLPTFFNRPTLKVAQELLGKFLVRKIGKKTVAGMITEVEAYVGPKDKASHASRGKTERTKVMFDKPGCWYVYLIYGIHHCLNIVTERKGYPAALLVRSVVIPSQHTNKLENVGVLHIIGPGKVCRCFKINKRFNGKPAIKTSGLWIEDRGTNINPRQIRRGKRIGVEYAGLWKNKLWRFYLSSDRKRGSLRSQTSLAAE